MWIRMRSSQSCLRSWTTCWTRLRNWKRFRTWYCRTLYFRTISSSATRGTSRKSCHRYNYISNLCRYAFTNNFLSVSVPATFTLHQNLEQVSMLHFQLRLPPPPPVRHTPVVLRRPISNQSSIVICEVQNENTPRCSRLRRWLKLPKRTRGELEQFDEKLDRDGSGYDEQVRQQFVSKKL